MPFSVKADCRRNSAYRADVLRDLAHQNGVRLNSRKSPQKSQRIERKNASSLSLQAQTRSRDEYALVEPTARNQDGKKEWATHETLQGGRHRPPTKALPAVRLASHRSDPQTASTMAAITTERVEVPPRASGIEAKL